MKLLLTSIILVLAFSVYAQWQIEPQIHIGGIIKHNPNELLYKKTSASIGGEIRLKYQTFGRKQWEQKKNYPALGLSLIYFNYGNDTELGHSLGIYPHLTVPIFRQEKTFMNFSLGAGIAYLNKHYDENTNPNNVAIGSHWNSVASFQFSSGYIFNPNWTGNIGLGLTHYSNGGTQHPNFGINIITGIVGLKYTPEPKTFIKNYHRQKAYKKWGLQMHYDMAFREYARSRKLRPIYIGTLAATYHFREDNRGLLGWAIEKNTGVEKFLLGQNWENQKAKQESTRQMVYVADEILYGDFSIYLELGVYLKKKALALEHFYEKISMRYYFMTLGKPKTQFFFGVYLKSHLATAEYIALGFGANL